MSSTTTSQADKAANDNPHLEKLRAVVAKSSTKPGVYRWLDKNGTVLYVGKAKNLRNRLRSYVQPAKDATLGPWKLSLVTKIADLDTTITSSELEALILETNLIKELKPKYNVMMKDDKHYVYVRVGTDEVYPDISIVRKMAEDKATYFGPYLAKWKVESILDFLQDIYDYRETKEGLQALNTAAKNKTDVKEVRSLAFQIGQSCGVALGKISREEYLERIEAVMRFFKGHHSDALKQAKELMATAATEKKFEKAAKLRDAVKAIEDISEKQIASDTSRMNTDAIGIALLSGKAQVVVMKERDGKLIDELSFALSGEADAVSEALSQFIPQFYTSTDDLPDTILLGEAVEEQSLLEEWLREMRGKKVQIAVPERGKKSQLLIMAEKNANAKIQQQFAKWEAAKQNIEEALEYLKNNLGLADIPKRIEGYDISHLGGTETVGSMVVMRNGKPANDHYRSFTIKTLKEGDVDDYAALQEVLRRRLLHLVRDVKQEEAQWKEQGVTFGKARKAEQEFIEQVIAEHPDDFHNENIDYKDFVVGRAEDEPITFARLFSHPGKVLEIKTLWVHDDWRGKQLGKFLIRKMMSSLKKEKVYVTIHPSLESYYADLGFRHVNTPPKVLHDEIEEAKKKGGEFLEGFAMVSLPESRKADASLGSKPDLLVIDGGKGQLSSVVAVLKELQLTIPVIGLAKREEEIFQPGRSLPTIFPKDSQAKFLLMRLRDEAHRFANRHREKRGLKKAVRSALDDVPGIGDKTKKELLKKFGSVSGIRDASDDELKAVVTEVQLQSLRESL